MSDYNVIEVEDLTKTYPETVAVSRISFTVSQGEVVGFLGPNGAGKTTTLKLLTCFMPATAGSARIDGHDIYTEPLRVRRSIGYLAETNPLYEEMKVAEYLRFRAALKGVRWRRRSEHVDEALSLCGLEHVAHRAIGHLSKGYRQRVGLADTLVAKPPLLILDEPTSGLDPQQIIEVRELIKKLAEKNTILLSTHHLPEVEQICDRVVLIHRGRIVLDDTMDNVRRGPDDVMRTLEDVFMEATRSDPDAGAPEAGGKAPAAEKEVGGDEDEDEDERAEGPDTEAADGEGADSITSAAVDEDPDKVAPPNPTGTGKDRR